MVCRRPSLRIESEPLVSVFEGGSGPGTPGGEFGVGWGAGACRGDAGACWDYTGAVCGEVDSHVQPRS